MTRAFIRALVSLRIVTCAALIAGYGVLTLSIQANSHRPVNGWDVIVPTLTDSFTTSLVGMILLSLWVVPLLAEFGEPSALIRYGSRIQAVRAGLSRIAGSLGAWALYLAIIGLCLGWPLGVPLEWSAAATADAHGTASAFAASSLAAVFAAPVRALLASAAYTGLFFLALGAVALALAGRGFVKGAQMLFIGFAVWSIVCSFSPLPIPPTLDAVIPANLGWALTMPGAAMGGVLVSICLVMLAAVLVRRESLRELGYLVTRSTVAVVITGTVIAVVGAWMAGPPDQDDLVRRYFGGAYGDVLTYLVVAALPLVFSTSFVSALSERAETTLLAEVIRWGSYRRWLARTYASQFPRAVVFTLAVGVGFSTVAVARGWALAGVIQPALAFGLVGVLVAIQTQIAVATLVLWAGAPLRTAWPIVSAAFLVVGYSVPASIGMLNVAAPYSLTAQPSTLPWAAELVAICFTAVIMTVTLLVASPARGDVLLHNQ